MKITRKKELEHKKQELKQDPFIEGVTSAWTKASGVGSYVIGGAILLVVIAGVIAVRHMVKSSGQDKSWAALSAAEDRISDIKGRTDEDEQKREDAAIEEYGKLAKELSGSDAHEPAVYYEAFALFKKGGDENLKKADQACREFIKSYPNSYYILPVKQLLAKTLFEQKKYEEALAAFSDVQAAFRSGKSEKMAGLQYEAAYHIGRCQQLLKRPDDARKTFEQLSREQEATPYWSEMAAYELGKLGS